MDTPATGTLTSPFVSSAGGVMTVEVGAITGELELATRPTKDGLDVRIRYRDAEEWYTVEGAPLPPDALDPASTPEGLHRAIVEHLHRAGPPIAGNEAPTSLSGFYPGGAGEAS